jgi:hypothetical protein
MQGRWCEDDEQRPTNTTNDTFDFTGGPFGRCSKKIPREENLGKEEDALGVAGGEPCRARIEGQSISSRPANDERHDNHHRKAILSTLFEKG